MVKKVLLTFNWLNLNHKELITRDKLEFSNPKFFLFWSCKPLLLHSFLNLTVDIHISRRFNSSSPSELRLSMTIWPTQYTFFAFSQLCFFVGGRVINKKSLKKFYYSWIIDQIEATEARLFVIPGFKGIRKLKIMSSKIGSSDFKSLHLKPPCKYLHKFLLKLDFRKFVWILLFNVNTYYRFQITEYIWFPRSHNFFKKGLNVWLVPIFYILSGIEILCFIYRNIFLCPVQSKLFIFFL